MNGQNQRHSDDYETGKSSFCASPQTLRHDRHETKHAINESLSAVQFNVQDMRTVMQSVRAGKKRASKKRRRSRLKPDLVFTFTLVLMVALPLSLYAFKSRGNITTIVTGPGEFTPPHEVSSQLDDDLVSPMFSAAPTSLPTFPPSAAQDNMLALTAGLLSEDDAVRIARDCFDAQCDTTIFTSDEYEVSITLSSGDAPQYVVTMESIYKNGCSFTVILSADTGEILQYSTPRLATVPGFIDSESAEVRAWFDKYGEHLFTWPQDVQAEFSRRYQGGTLRAAREGEISYEQALNAVSRPVMSEAPGLYTSFYPVLYSERASSDGNAFYTVYCYASASDDVLRDGEPMMISFDAASGEIISIEGNPLDHPIDIQSVNPNE